MNLRDWLAATARSWVLVLGAGALGAAGAAGLAYGNNPSYTAVSKVAVVAAPEGVKSAENAGQLTHMIRSELSLYQALARSAPVAERAAARLPGIAAAEVSAATSATGTDQVVVLSVSLPDSTMAVAIASAVAEELAVEIEALHPGTPALVNAEALDLPVGAATAGLSWRLMAVAGGTLGLVVGLTLAWWRAALSPVVGTGTKLSQRGHLVLRAEPDEASFQQLGALVTRALRSAPSDTLVLVGSGRRVNLGPWRTGLMEQIAAHASAVTTAANGADAAALAAVGEGAVTLLVVDRRDPLTEIEQAAVLLQAAGAQLAAILVVSEPRV